MKLRDVGVVKAIQKSLREQHILGGKSCPGNPYPLNEEGAPSRPQSGGVANPPGPLLESLWPFGPEVSPECPEQCPLKRGGGVSESVRRGVSRTLWAPGSRVSKSVPRVSKRCLGYFGDTLGTLLGHSRARGPEGPETPSLQPPPRFRGHSSGHSGDTSAPKGPRDSCSRPGASQGWGSKRCKASGFGYSTPLIKGLKLHPLN